MLDLSGVSCSQSTHHDTDHQNCICHLALSYLTLTKKTFLNIARSGTLKSIRLKWRCILRLHSNLPFSESRQIRAIDSLMLKKSVRIQSIWSLAVDIVICISSAIKRFPPEEQFIVTWLAIGESYNQGHWCSDLHHNRHGIDSDAVEFIFRQIERHYTSFQATKSV